MEKEERQQIQIEDLLTKAYYKDVEAEFYSRDFKYVDENKDLGLKTGDIVEFWGGFHSDIRYRSKILGFTPEGKAFMFWDCYWFPVDLQQRDYNKVLDIIPSIPTNGL